MLKSLEVISNIIIIISFVFGLYVIFRENEEDELNKGENYEEK